MTLGVLSEVVKSAAQSVWCETNNKMSRQIFSSLLRTVFLLSSLAAVHDLSRMQKLVTLRNTTFRSMFLLSVLSSFIVFLSLNYISLFRLLLSYNISCTSFFVHDPSVISS